MPVEKSKIELTYALLDSPSQANSSTAKLSSCWNSLGLYHSTQYVIRLSYSVHNLVDSATQKKQGITWEEYQAFSTYLHETVHWWQHIGSTIGFIMSMCYPAQAHTNMESLQYLAKSKFAKKPLMEWAEAEMRNGKDHSTPDIAHANTVTNNVLDIAYYRTLIMNAAGINKIASQNYFESTAHSFNIAYTATLNILRALFDPESKFLPNPDDWYCAFEYQKNSKKAGHYYGSPIEIYPTRGLDIVEGQARFIQLQFLSSASKDELTVQQIESEGYLRDEYGNAFRYFLKHTNSTTPLLIDSPLVALFLLLCDISLNPSEGFPKTIINATEFHRLTDCNYRFIALCAAVNENPQIKNHIKEYSKKEYLEVSQVLTSYCGFAHPYEIPSLIMSWKSEHESIRELLKQQETFDYNEDSILIRVLFSHFITFNLDKYESPEFFCWGGKHLKFGSAARNKEQLWLRNLSLYSDSADETTIFPRKHPGKPEANIKKTFDLFYAANLMYDISNQWITKSGPFEYDFSWLTEREESQVLSNKTKELFEKNYTINPDNIKH